MLIELFLETVRVIAYGMTLENDQSSDRSSIDNDRNEHQQQQRQQQQQQQQSAPKSVKSVLRSTTKSGYVANMEGTYLLMETTIAASKHVTPSVLLR